MTVVKRKLPSIDDLEKTSDPIHPIPYPKPRESPDEDKYPTIEARHMGMHGPEDEDGEIEGLAWSDYMDSPLIRRGNPDSDNRGEGPYPEEPEDGSQIETNPPIGTELSPRQKAPSSYTDPRKRRE